MLQKKIYVPTFHFNPEKSCYCASGELFGQCCGSKTDQKRKPKGIFLVPGFVSSSDCKQLVRHLEKQKRNWLTVFVTDAETQQVVKKKHPVRVTQAVDPDKKAKLLLDLIRKALIEEIAPRIGVQAESFEIPSVMRYPPGGKYLVHADGEAFDKNTKQWYRNLNRDVSFLLYLNDDYTGGELNFPHLNYKFKPKAGDLAFFPSNHIYMHESVPIASGVKYAVVSWVQLVGSRRVDIGSAKNSIETIKV